MESWWDVDDDGAGQDGAWRFHGYTESVYIFLGGAIRRMPVTDGPVVGGSWSEKRLLTMGPRRLLASYEYLSTTSYVLAANAATI